MIFGRRGACAISPRDSSGNIPNWRLVIESQYNNTNHASTDEEVRNCIVSSWRACARTIYPTLATSRYCTKPDSDQWDSSTEWHRVMLWDDLAQGLTLAKGDQVQVEGEFRGRKRAVQI